MWIDTRRSAEAIGAATPGEQEIPCLILHTSQRGEVDRLGAEKHAYHLDLQSYC